MSRVSRSLFAIALLVLPALAWAEQPTIKIGAIFALTGPAAEFGLSASEGIRYALDDINKAGGLDVKGTKYKLELIAYDDQLKPADAIAAFTRLVERDKVGYIFDMISSSHLAIKPMAESEDVFLLTTAVSDKGVEPDTKHIVRIQSRPRDWIPGVVRWLKTNVPGQRVALFNPNDESGRAFDELATAEMQNAGYSIVSRELYERTLKDFSPLLTRVLSTNPDLIDLGGTAAATAGLIVRQARDLGYKKAFIMLGGTGARGIIDAAGPAAAEGIVHMVFADTGNAAYRQIAARYRAKFGQTPNELIANFYDGAVALTKAIELGGDPNAPLKARAAFPNVFPLKSLEGGTLTFGGRNSIGVDAQVFTTNYVAIVKNGESVVVGTASSR